MNKGDEVMVIAGMVWMGYWVNQMVKNKVLLQMVLVLEEWMLKSWGLVL